MTFTPSPHLPMSHREVPTTGGGGLTWLWCFLFGPLFFLSKGIWLHAALSFIAASCTFGLSIFIYPFFARGIVDRFSLGKE